jgi:septum formation topological specificity factor MinE
MAQEMDYGNYDNNQVIESIARMKLFKEDGLRIELNEIMELVDHKTKRSLTLAQEKGAGSWLSVPPIRSLGYVLNKQEFRDSICLRYDWKIPNTPNYCQCGKKNNVDHALSCKKGGFLHLRHDQIRNLDAELMKEVCKDVRIEPELLPLQNQQVTGNTADKARLDVSGIGVWAPMERSFIDVRVIHPNCATYVNQELPSLFEQHEKQKKRAYNERVLNVEKGSFTPIVLATTGGMGNEAQRFHKRLAVLIAQKRNEDYADVLNHIRTRLRFCLLKSTLIALRGVRGRQQKKEELDELASISYNLINLDD